MNIDLNKAMKDCEGVEKVQERTNAGVVSLNNKYNIHLIFPFFLFRDKNLTLQLMKKINKNKKSEI